MANLAIFKPPEHDKKWSEMKFLFTFELQELISSIRYKNFWLEIIISIGENWLIKKNLTEHKYSGFFESRNKKLL